jgi:hypothetical protein
MKKQWKSRTSRRTTYHSQENMSILSHSVFCIALGMKATASGCSADNTN